MISAVGSMNVYPVLLLVLVLLQAMASDARSSSPSCVPSSCGDIRNISHPFRLKTDPMGCGDLRYELACEDHRTVLYVSDARFYVRSIDYSQDGYSIRLVDDGLQKDNCSYLSRRSDSRTIMEELFSVGFIDDYPDQGTVVIVNCSKPVSSPLYISTGTCIKGMYSSNTSSNWYLYALLNPTSLDMRDSCSIHSSTWVSKFTHEDRITSSSYNYEMIHNFMAEGFDAYFDISDWKTTFFCFFDSYTYLNFHTPFLREHYDSGSHKICGSKDYFRGK